MQATDKEKRRRLLRTRREEALRNTEGVTYEAAQFELQIVLFIPPCTLHMGCLHDGRWDDFDVLK